MGSPQKIKQIARRVQQTQAAGNRVVVVVSAMNDTTDQFTRLAYAVTNQPSRREMDMLLTAGERITMALLSMALQDLGAPAISFTGSQTGIITDTTHGEAHIVDVRPIRVGPELDQGKVVIVAGFQGVSLQKEVTTLGRGGSDTTAIALAAGLKADTCEICTDVPGVMTADPRLVANARLRDHLTWDVMEALAIQGANVIHHRAATMAREQEIPYRICSAFGEGSGTRVEGILENTAQSFTVTAVTGCVASEAKTAAVALVGRGPISDALVSQARRVLAEAGITSTKTRAENFCLTLSVPVADYPGAVQALHRAFIDSL